jgi:glycosyltransferase involved in cell wall biosynthesis
LKQKFALIGNAAAAILNFRLPLIQTLCARGHMVFALAPDFAPSDKERLLAIGVKPVDFSMKRTGLNPVSDLMGTASIYRALRSIAPDTVLSFGIKPATFGNIAAKIARVPNRFILVTGLGYAFTESGKSGVKRGIVGSLARALYWLSLRYAQGVFMQNPDDAQDFVRLGIVAQDKIIAVNGTGVKLDEWPAAPPVSEPIIFTLGARMVADKGILEFVSAARNLKKIYPDVQFALVGGLDSNPEAIGKEQLLAWTEEGAVKWHGHVDMRSQLEKTSVFVLPSYREGIPRSSQEAMAMGRPIITTDAPGCRETVIEGDNGYLVPVRDSQALALAMRRFIEKPGLISIMGQQSRKIAEERFDVNEINAVMIEAMGL